MKLANRFEILNILEQGNYGITYRAIDHHSPRHPDCVVQELSHTSPRVVKRLRHEAQALEAIGTHSHIPTLIASFDEGNQFYIVQKLIDGHDLRQEIRAGKRLDESYVVKLLLDVLHVLAFVHDHRIIHRNIHPGNLIRQRSNGDIVLINFGGIKELSQADDQGRISNTVNVGTAGYIAPEQARGKPCYGSDLYAVGMVAIAALTTMHPKYLAINPLTKQIQWSDKTISPALERFIKQLIEPNPKKRFLTARDALKELQRTITGIRVSQDSKLPTHVAAKRNVAVDSAPTSTKTIKPISTKLIVKVMASLTTVLLMLGFGVKGYQWTAYTLSRQWDAIKPVPKSYAEAHPDTLANLLDDGSIQAQPEVVEAFWAMTAAAQNEGVDLLPLAGYISLTEQRKQLKKRTDTDLDIRQWLKQSDYHSGYALAIGDKNADESTDWDISFERTDGYRWLKRYAQNYGFELSYPQGNPAGEQEPWHWRYKKQS
ncbi:MAG: D-alanyl-D-alanine carboxypeptidase family protein [Cyanobacteria bacterium P01_D01_bin.56]